jgi:hypothetical protein
MNLKKRDCFTFGFAVTLNVFFFLVFAANGLAGGKKDFKRFQLEVYSGHAAFNPADLNSIVDYDNSIRAFYYDSQFNYLRNTYQVWSWTCKSQGEMKKLKRTSPVGLRLKYFLNPSLAVSFCLKHFSQEESHIPSFKYTQVRRYGEQYIEDLIYSPYSLSAQGFSPLVGLHLVKPLTGSFLLEGFFSGGPLFAQCCYVSDWRYYWTIRDTSGTQVATVSEGRLEQQGEGSGLALELGLRLNFRLNRWLGTFLTVGYSRQKVSKISGQGSEKIGTIRQDWQGEWAMNQEKLIAPWGTLEVQFPTNYWPSGDGKVGDFQLDLSGFQLRLGIFVRF